MAALIAAAAKLPASFWWALGVASALALGLVWRVRRWDRRGGA